jgi:predicted amidohydrolase
MSTLTIALLQMVSHGTDQDANLKKGDRFCRIAGQLGADIALFPEMWNIGYSDYAPGVWETDFDPLDPAHAAARAAWQARSIDANSPYVIHFRDLARELDMAIAITYLETWPGAPRNTVSVIDRHGEIVLTYAKVHTCDFGMEEACTPGEDFYVCALDTAHGPVQVGAMICYDREFPESARILMLKGAEIILTPNACTLEQHRIEQFRTRAYENMVGVAMTNYAAPQHNGHSVAFDGIAFGDTSRDMLVVGAGESEGVYLTPFDLDALREYRAREIWGNAFRRPRVYHALTAPDVQPPFVRDRARR